MRITTRAFLLGLASAPAPTAPAVGPLAAAPRASLPGIAAGEAADPKPLLQKPAASKDRVAFASAGDLRIVGRAG